ncbi:MAG: cytochrome c oxidase subunit 3 [Pseudobdellovibrionaceae bacterium]
MDDSKFSLQPNTNHYSTNAKLGMWIFLTTEVLFFGAVFFLYSAYRFTYPQTFAVASNYLDILLGSINTCILLTSSFSMACAVHLVRLEKRKTTILALLATAGLGFIFLCIKGYEYYDKYKRHLLPGFGFISPKSNPPHLKLFFSLYLTGTALHAVHVLMGILIILYFVLRMTVTKKTFVEATDLTGLYWHFVDLVWIFLFPLFYLLGRNS